MIGGFVTNFSGLGIFGSNDYNTIDSYAYDLSSQYSHWGSEEESYRLLVIGGFTMTYNRPLRTQLGVFTFTFTSVSSYFGSSYINLSCRMVS